MAASTEPTTMAKKTNSRRVCFSFAAYAKNVISHLNSCKVLIVEGLTDEEFTSIEESLGFTFPPDLRSILSEGLPVGPGFPNWRSSSSQLEILINLPILEICKEISKKKLWCQSWGNQPDDVHESLTLVKQLLKKAPVLVPIYRHCYIPSSPSLAGNPVFFVRGNDLRFSGLDIAGFFRRVEFNYKNNDYFPFPAPVPQSLKAPAWAGKAARKIEFWSESVETVKLRGWRRVLGEGYFEEMRRNLRKGGWKEEEIREMMSSTKTMKRGNGEEKTVLNEKECVVPYIRLQSLKLLQAGWSYEDVNYSFGFQDEGVVLPELKVLPAKGFQVSSSKFAATP